MDIHRDTYAAWCRDPKFSAMRCKAEAVRIIALEAKIGKQCQRHGPFAILIEDFDRSAPAFALCIVDLSKVKDLPLDKLATPATAILDDVPVTMLFAVLESRVALQKHYGHRFHP